MCCALITKQMYEIITENNSETGKGFRNTVHEIVVSNDLSMKILTFHFLRAPAVMYHRCICASHRVGAYGELPLQMTSFQFTEGTIGFCSAFKSVVVWSFGLRLTYIIVGDRKVLLCLISRFLLSGRNFFAGWILCFKEICHLKKLDKFRGIRKLRTDVSGRVAQCMVLGRPASNILYT